MIIKEVTESEKVTVGAAYHKICSVILEGRAYRLACLEDSKKGFNMKQLRLG